MKILLGIYILLILIFWSLCIAASKSEKYYENIMSDKEDLK